MHQQPEPAVRAHPGEIPEKPEVHLDGCIGQEGPPQSGASIAHDDDGAGARHQ